MKAKTLVIVLVGVIVAMMASAPPGRTTLQPNAPSRVVVTTVVGGYVDRLSQQGESIVYRFWSNGAVDSTFLFAVEPCFPVVVCGTVTVVEP